MFGIFQDPYSDQDYGPGMDRFVRRPMRGGVPDQPQPAMSGQPNGGYDSATVNRMAPNPANGGGPDPSAQAQPVVKAAIQPPNAPQYDSDTINRLRAQKQELQKPLDPNKPEYRMPWWQRIVGGLANAASGFGHTGSAPVFIGPGAKSNQYYQDEALRQKKLAATGQDIADYNTEFGEQEKAFRAQEDAYKGNALVQEREAKAQKYENAIDPNSIRQDEQTGKWYGRAYGDPDKEIETSAPRWAQQGNRELQKRQADLQVNRQIADELGLKGDDLTYFLANGKLKEPDPYAQERIDLMRQSLQDRRDNAAANNDLRWASQTSNEYLRYQAQQGEYARKKADIVQREKDAFAALEKQYRDPKTGQITDPVKLENAKKDTEAQYNREYEALGPAPSLPPTLQITPKQPAPKQAQPGKPQAAPAKQASPKNKQPEERIRVREKATGKTGTLPKSQVQSAISSGKYETL